MGAVLIARCIVTNCQASVDMHVNDSSTLDKDVY